MTVVSMNYLLEAGVHFGHQTKRWNPKMKEYIFTSRDDIYIIDLQKTVKKLEEAYDALKEIAEKEGKVLFVGTKKQAQEAAEESADRGSSAAGGGPLQQACQRRSGAVHSGQSSRQRGAVRRKASGADSGQRRGPGLEAG